MATDEIKRIAYHEAGHAVVSVRLRLVFEKVSIISDGDSLGYVSSRPDKHEKTFLYSDSQQKRYAILEAISCFAGEAAECELTGEQPDENIFGSEGKSSSQDYQGVYYLLTDFVSFPGFKINYPTAESGICEEICDDTWVSNWHELRNAARRLVKQNWQIIQLVAGQLIEHQELSEQQVREIYQSATKDGRGG